MSVSGWETDPVESDLQDYMKEYCISCNSVCTKMCNRYSIDTESNELKSNEDSKSNEEEKDEKTNKYYEEIAKQIIMNAIYE
jgi:uncharacterized protein YutD